MLNHLQQTELEHSFKTTHSTPASDTDMAKIMGERSRYGRERLPSEQVEKLRTNFAFALSTQTPEPRLEASSETSQPVTISSPQRVLPKQKRKRNNTNVLRESEPRNTSPGPESDVALEMPPPTTRGPSLSIPPARKRKRASDFFVEREPNENSPELKSASRSETPRPITRGLSQPPARKQKRKSKMLRELDPYNESPEQDSEADIGMLHESTKFPTRSATHKLESFLKDKTPTPPKDLNVDRLMYAELRGTPKGTKTYYFPDNSNPGSSSHQKQPESRLSTVVEIKQEDAEGILRENLVTSDQSRSQSKPTRRTMSQQSRNSSGKGRQDHAVAPESSWSMWDREKGQSSLNTALAVPLL